MVRSAQALDIHIRVGVHTGEVDLSGGDARGLAVHTAARILALAGPDEVVVSSTTNGLRGLRVDLEDAGAHQLKGTPACARVPVGRHGRLAERRPGGEPDALDGDFSVEKATCGGDGISSRPIARREERETCLPIHRRSTKTTCTIGLG
jgi:hypothetical protein